MTKHQRQVSPSARMTGGTCAFGIRMSLVIGALTCVALPCLGGATDEFKVKRKEVFAFTQKPAVTRDGDAVTITFASKDYCDVTAAVETKDGRIIRHLAAGVLGPNPPAPLQKNALKQALVWDGRDDLGRPAKGGPFRARVSLGLLPTFEKFIGHNRADGGFIRALATAPNGEVFVAHSYASHHPGDSSAAISVFSRKGKYLRTIAPFPAGLPDEKLSGLKRITLSDGSKVPFIYQIETRSLIPGLGPMPLRRLVATRDGRLAFVGIQEGPRYSRVPGESRLTVIRADGSMPIGGPRRARLAAFSTSAADLALSPDEKTIYFTSFSTCRPATIYVGDGLPSMGYQPRGLQRHHAVYKLGWDDDKPTVFAGDKAESGGGKTRLNTPVSVAADGQGKVYVADRGNDRIAVFRPDGRFLTQIAVKTPRRVEIHKKTGAVYALAGGKDAQLIKFSGSTDPREVARCSGHGARVIALDDSADPPVIWMSTFRRGRIFVLLRVEDRGTSFGEPADITASIPEAKRSVGAVYELSLDPQRGLLYVNNYSRYHLATDKWESLPRPKGWGRMWPNSTPMSTIGAVGLDGDYYMNIGANGARVCRFGPDLKPKPFPQPDRQDVLKGTDEPTGRIVGFARSHGRGLTADPQGNVYVIWKKFPKDPGDAHRAQALYVYGSSGRLKKPKLVNASVPSINGVRVDYAGNIYLACGLRPGTAWFPRDFEGQIPRSLKDPRAAGGLNGYPLIYGSIIKFGPDGGEIRDQIGGVKCNYAHGTPIEVKGAQWIFPGASTVSSWATPKRDPRTVNICLCEATCFDVDGFGRSFFPDAGRFRVGVIDTNGNEICWFGRYGNADSTRMSFCWPQAVATIRTRMWATA